jgi:mRNA-degrading endonuclease RelE of RelBE toxin-antitoxin system
MALPSELPSNISLVASASRDLAKLCTKNRQEFLRLWDDLVRLGNEALPPQGKKKLKGMDAYQLDSGRYRIVYTRREASYIILAVFAKPDQRDYLKHLR